ncbi:hypothetical protein GF420_13375 [candidate division GN15 bacterium]|nr:hypothetical protein [candidate division GN15 bacterium]
MIHQLARFCFALALLCLTAGMASAQPGAVNPELLKQFEERLANTPELRARINAVTNNSIKDLALNRSTLTGHDDLFNVKVEGSGIIDQHSSGRCWMFAGSNVVAPKVMTKLELGDFKISEAYLAFWDKLEKSNRFLETMIRLRDKPVDDRLMQMYLRSPLGDGGWWHYFTSLTEKYGVVPASVMPETKQSSSTGMINKLATTLLRKGAAGIRERHADGQSVEQLRGYKETVLADIYDLLVYTYGAPPKEFTFRWESGADSTKAIVEKSFTPQSFFTEFFGEQMPEYVAIAHNPAEELNRLYNLESSRNIEERPDMQAMNLPIERLKHYTKKSLLDSQIVWFACDVGEDNYNDSGIFAIDVYDYNTAFGKDFKLDKADRIRYQDMSPNHAMVIKGMDTSAAGAPRKWLVENSWGTDRGNKGLWTMYDGWFDEWVLLVIIDKRLLEDAELALLETEPITIEEWEPFFLALRNLELRR